MAKRDFTPQGCARQRLKDLEMVHEFSAASKSPLPPTAQSLALYRLLVLVLLIRDLKIERLSFLTEAVESRVLPAVGFLL